MITLDEECLEDFKFLSFIKINSICAFAFCFYIDDDMSIESAKLGLDGHNFTVKNYFTK